MNPIQSPFRRHAQGITKSVWRQSSGAVGAFAADGFYSPDLNRIEHLWAARKARLRQNLPHAPDPSFLSLICANVIIKFYTMLVVIFFN